MSPPPASLHSPAAVPRSPSRNSLLECCSQKEVTLKFVPPAPPDSPADGHARSQQEPLSANHHRLSHVEIDALHWVSKLKRWVRSGAAGWFSWGEPQINKAAAVNPCVIFGTLNWWRCAVAVLRCVCACASWPGDYVLWIHGAPKNHPPLNCIEICKWKAKQQIKALHAVTADK